MNAGTRVRLTDAVRWPARIGTTGVVVGRHQVRDGLPAPGTVPVLLDLDPLATPTLDVQRARGWTCQVPVHALEVLP